MRGYREALSRYRGSYVENDPYAEWAQNERRRLHSRLYRRARGSTPSSWQNRGWSDRGSTGVVWGWNRLQTVEPHSVLVRLLSVELAELMRPLELLAAVNTVRSAVGTACFGCTPTEEEPREESHAPIVRVH